LQPTSRPQWLKGWLSGILGALLMAGLTGFPDGPFASDWIKHWALLHELTVQPWPVVIELNQQVQILRFYVGAYLVPAGLAKLSHSDVGGWAAVWFTLGYALIFRTVARRQQGTALVAIGLLLAMSGADALADHLHRRLLGWPAPPWLGIHNEAWAYGAFELPLEYSGVVTALAWVPHQAIAVYLVTLEVLNRDNRPARSALALGLLALWSPYGLIGLLPLVATEVWARRRELSGWRLHLCVIAGLGFAITVASYLASDLPQGTNCLACLPEHLQHAAQYLPFLGFELAPFALILGRQMWRDRLNRAALLCLLILPLFHAQTPDLVMRASLAPILLLALRSVERLMAGGPALLQRLAPLVGLALALPSVVSEVTYLRQGAAAHQAYAKPDPLSAPWMRLVARERRYTAAQFFDLCGWQYLPQYFAPHRPVVLSEPE
ncbi:MAG TPA: hypothetical protein VGE47_06200, partial [Burkholderiaceae bacterium]